MDEKTFLGKGWAFPPSFNKDSNNIEMVSQYLDIKQSLEIYFNTKLGERIMRPDYGCVIHDHLFERLDQSVLDILSFELTQNIGKIEPRIKVDKINVKMISPNDGLIEVLAEYTVITTNVRDNIVFPFYINEGTHIK
tara:strand:+ start:2112 stop:2522 length:411 start_codon:yes stop_codon:yes gene_type:complete